MLNNRQQLC